MTWLDEMRSVLVLYGPILAYGVTSIKLLTHHSPLLTTHHSIKLLYLLSGIGLWISALYRPDYIHLSWVASLGYILLIKMILDFKWRRISQSLLMIILMLTIFSSGNQLLQAQQRQHFPVSTPRGKFYAHNAHEAKMIHNVLSFLETHIQPGTYLYTYPYDSLLRFFVEAKDPTPYSVLLPGLWTQSHKEEILRRLEKTKTNWILLDQEFRKAIKLFYPQSVRRNMDDSWLMSYIQKNYQLAFESKPFFEVWKRHPKSPDEDKL